MFFAHQMPNKNFTGIGFLFFIGLSLFIIYYDKNYPYVYVGLLWLFICCCKIVFSKKAKSKLFWIYLGGAIFAFGFAEAFFAGILSFNFDEKSFRTERKLIKGGFNKNHQFGEA